MFCNVFFAETECVDAMPTTECVEAELLGDCENINWATENCAKTCDLCCGLC